MDIESAVLAEPDAEGADSLVSENDPDELAGEQTWPTEDDMRGTHPGADGEHPDAQSGTTPKAVKRVPKGMSEYQATWILDDDEGEEGDEDEEDAGDAKEAEMEEEDIVEVGDDEMETDTRKSVAFQDMDMEEEEDQ